MTTLKVNPLKRRVGDCKYHVVVTPKDGKKVLYGMLRQALQAVLYRLATEQDRGIEASQLMPDHVHRLIANKPKHLVGHKFWARGYFVSTVGADEQVVKPSIQNQAREGQRLANPLDR